MPYAARIYENLQWYDHAACKKHPQHWWFPTITRSKQDDYDRARPICAVCPVKDECLAFGNTQLEGMWGGKTPEERDGDRRRLKAAEMARWRLQPDGTKLCRRCETVKPASGFPSNAKASDRLHPYCSQCRNSGRTK